MHPNRKIGGWGWVSGGCSEWIFSYYESTFKMIFFLGLGGAGGLESVFFLQRIKILKKNFFDGAEGGGQQGLGGRGKEG